jgi:hypothetical protein
LFMVQRCKFSIELKNFPPDLSGEPIFFVRTVGFRFVSCEVPIFRINGYA